MAFLKLVKKVLLLIFFFWRVENVIHKLSLSSSQCTGLSLPSLTQGEVSHWSIPGWLPHFQTPGKCCESPVLCLELFFSLPSPSLCCHLNKTSHDYHCVMPHFFIRVSAGTRRMRGVEWMKEVERYMAQTAAVSYPTSPDRYHMFSHLCTNYKCLNMTKQQFSDT